MHAYGSICIWDLGSATAVKQEADEAKGDAKKAYMTAISKHKQMQEKYLSETQDADIYGDALMTQGYPQETVG